MTCPRTLYEEDIVLIDMRTDAASRRCATDHQVVDPPVGDEKEFCQVATKVGQMLFDILNKQGPVLLGQFP